MKKEFIIELDDFVEELFYEMEEIQDGYIDGNKPGHKCVVQAKDQEEALYFLKIKLTPFLLSKIKEVKQCKN